MPYAVSTFILPCGTPATRADGSGVITAEAATELMAKIGPGGEQFGRPLLVLTQQMTKMSPEARSIFSASGDPTADRAWCAVVVTSPVIRVTVNFLLRVSKAPTVKLFSSEPDAIAWLDERVRVDGPTMPARQPPLQPR
jgi:hypothetical protein